MERLSNAIKRCLDGVSGQPVAAEPPPAEETVDLTFYNQPPEPPLEVFPQEIRQLLKQAATAFKNAPIEVPLVGLLSLLSGSIGRSRTIEVKCSWQESGNLCIVLVGDSGIGKSHCFKAMLKPIWDEDLNRKEQWEGELSRFNAEVENHAKDKGEKSEPQAKPIRRQYIIEDTTIEAIGKISSENPRGLLWMADELAGLLGSLDRYSSGRNDTGVKARILSAYDSMPSKASQQQKPEAEKGIRYTFEQIITQNQDMKRAIEVMARSSDTDSAVMINGETGSGKEMFAQAAHHYSRRAQKHFLAVSCAAIPENLLEGLLFGTVKGAFTGAQDRPGMMEMADGGTLFLDEINSMPLGLQSKLLRAIQEKTVKRVGGTKDKSVSLKIISATNNHPHRAVVEGQLRPDLLYRLGVVIVEIPPLRERKDDLVLLADHFIEKFNTKFGKSVSGLSPAMTAAFMAHHWPGNVRELEHVIESAMNLISSSETTLDTSHFSSSLLTKDIMDKLSLSSPEMYSETRSAVSGRTRGPVDPDEPARIIKALESTGGNIAKAAKTLNISSQLLHHKLKNTVSKNASSSKWNNRSTLKKPFKL